MKENIRRNHTKWLILWILPRQTWRASASHALICGAEQPQSEWFLSLMCCATNSMFPIKQKAANRDQQGPISANSVGHTAEILVSYSVFVLSPISEQSALCLCFVLMFSSKGPGVCRWSLLLCVFGVSYMISSCCVLVLSDPAKDLCGFCVKPFYGWGFLVNLPWKIDSP